MKGGGRGKGVKKEDVYMYQLPTLSVITLYWKHVLIKINLKKELIHVFSKGRTSSYTFIL